MAIEKTVTAIMDLRTLRNLGPKSTEWLAEIGVTSIEDVQRMGVVHVFCILKEEGYNASANLLYALEAAVRDIDWRELDAETKVRLRREAGID